MFRLCLFACQTERKDSHWPPQTGPSCKQTPTGSWALGSQTGLRVEKDTDPPSHCFHTHTHTFVEVCVTPSCGSAMTLPDSHSDTQHCVY